MQIVHILCDQRELWNTSLHLHQRVMTGVRAYGFDSFAPPGIPIPDQLRITGESIRGGELSWLVLRPESGLSITEGPQSAFLRDPRSRQNNNTLRIAQFFH